MPEKIVDRVARPRGSLATRRYGHYGVEDNLPSIDLGTPDWEPRSTMHVVLVVTFRIECMESQSEEIVPRTSFC